MASDESPPAFIQAPYAQAMVICETIAIDPLTGKRSLLGLFTMVNARTFPAVLATMAVYAAITDCRGRFHVVLQLIDVDETREPIFRREGILESEDPLVMAGEKT